MGPTRARRGGAPRGVRLVACLALAFVGGAVPFSQASHHVAIRYAFAHTSRISARRLLGAVQLTFTRRRRRIPATFFGISMEYDGVGNYDRDGALFDRALSLVRPGNESLMPLRVGGRSANKIYWNMAPGHAPRFVIELGKRWLAQLADLARRDGLLVKLDLNLPVHSPAMAAAFARATSRALPRGRLAELAIGNEPDFYGKQLHYERERTATTLRSTPLNWAVGYSPTDYWRDFRVYARRLHAAVPGVPVGGPDIPSYVTGWVQGAPSPRNGGPQAIEIHHYAASTCWGPTNMPTVQELLAPRAVGGIRSSGGGALGFAQAHRLPFFFSEFNAVSLCGKTRVAKSFATALWAPDALFEMISAGVEGINLHLRPSYINAPFHLGSGTLTPRPELYGLALFARIVGPHAMLLGVRLRGAGHLNAKAWAVDSGAGLRLLLIDKDSRSIDVAVPAGTATTPAHLERLQAPSPSSDSGVTLAGQRIGRNGRFYDRKIIKLVSARDGSYRVHLPAYSAAMLEVPRT
jgi:hypothetical protein